MKNFKNRVITPSEAEWEEQKLGNIKNDDAVGVSTSIEMSIEETNKLRAQLGLKPLEVDTENGDGSTKTNDYVHEPAKNISDIKSQEKIREKISTMREKRENLKNFDKVKKISDQINDEDLENTTKWIERMRKIQPNVNNESDLAKSTAQLSTRNSEHKTDGLSIAHRLNEFEKDNETILVLRDSNILDDEEDVLENPQLNEIRKAKQNVMNKSRKSDYNPYNDEDEEQYDNDYNLENDTILTKYNNEIERPKIPLIKIGEKGQVSINGQLSSVSEQLRQKYGTKSVSLNSIQPMSSIQDYYTHEEMIKMKQRKRKIKSKIVSKNIKLENDSSTVDEIIDFHKRKLTRTTIDNNGKSTQKHTQESIIDPAYDELESILSKSRSRIQNYQPKLTNIAEKIYDSVLNKQTNLNNDIEMKSDNENNEEQLVMDDIGEFVRSHTTSSISVPFKNTNTYNDGSESDDDDDDTLSVEYENNNDESKSNTNSHKSITHLVEEPILGKGLATALNFARSKGYIDEDKKILKTYKCNLPKTNAVIDEERTKGGHNYRSNDRYEYSNRGSFPEKNDYNPEIKLENIDKNGNILSVKEAFRIISHKFHGNRPGKLKQYKHKRKLMKEKADEISSIGANNIDSTMKMLNVLTEKQKLLQTPYLVLSGSAKGSIVNGPNKLSKK